jgi:hypothetical protein
MQEKSQEKPLYFYVANLGSEIQRIFSWKEKGDKEATENAYKRAISIINTIKKFGNKSANIEMDILQKSLKESILDRNQMSSYFSPFALRVMNSLNS